MQRFCTPERRAKRMHNILNQVFTPPHALQRGSLTYTDSTSTLSLTVVVLAPTMIRAAAFSTFVKTETERERD